MAHGESKRHLHFGRRCVITKSFVEESKVYVTLIKDRAAKRTYFMALLQTAVLSANIGDLQLVSFPSSLLTFTHIVHDLSQPRRITQQCFTDVGDHIPIPIP